MARTVTLYLLDGEDAAGRIKCTISNWTGIAYRIPQKNLELCNRGGDDCSKHLKQSGIYFLFGYDPKSGERGVYVGQAGARANGKGLLGRVLESHPTINWTEAVMFTRKDDSFGSTEISYLENQFYWLAKEGCYKVLNGNVPNEGNVREELKSELDEFIDYAKIVMCFLGHNALELVSQRPILRDKFVYHLSYKDYKAKGKRTKHGFAVLAGSEICPTEISSCPKDIQKMRRKYADKIDNKNMLTSDIEFENLSAAASFVCGSSRTGNMAWRDYLGRMLRDLENEKRPRPAPTPGRIPLFLEYKGYKAKGTYISDKEFVILKGSMICPEELPSCPDPIRKMRRKYADKIDDKNVITSDLTLKSPSTAAGLVCGSSRNGNVAWCDANGKKLGKLLKED